MQAVDVRDLEIEHRLDAYARARLSPDPISVARTINSRNSGETNSARPAGGSSTGNDGRR